MILFRALVVRWIARHRLRSLLAVAAVALGVAAFLATSAIGGSVERTSSAAVNAISGGADVCVEAEGTGVPSAWAAEIRSVQGVAAASPFVLGWVNVRGATGGRALLVGADPAAERAMRRRTGAASPPRMDPAQMLAFAAGTAAVVTRPLADELGVAAGGRVTLPGPAGAVTLSVAAVVDPGAAEAALGGRALAVTLPAGQRLLGRGANADRIDVRLAEGGDADGVARRVRDVIGDRAPPRLHVGPPRPSDPAVADVLGAVSVALRIGAAVALLIGMFLIHHTVSVGVAERRREVGVLRALGATERQVRRVFAGEAALLGLTGSILGAGLGALLATGALRGFAGAISTAYFASEPAPVEISLPLAGAGVALGTFVALAAAWLPAARAASEPPNDAMRQGPEETSGRRLLPRPRVAFVAVSAAAAVALVLVPSLAGRWNGYLAAAAVMLAFLGAAPAVLALGAKALAPLLRSSFGVPGRLAADELARHPGRAALPAAALAFGLALVVETAGTMTTLRDGTTQWMEEQVAGDLFVSSGRAVMGAGGHNPLEASLGADLLRVPGVTHAPGVRFRHVPWRDTKVLVLALGMSEYRGMAKLTVHGGRRDDVLAEVQRGGACLVSANFLHLTGVRLGDVVELPGARREVPLRVAGSFSDYSWPRGTVLVDLGVLAREFDDGLVDEFSVKLAQDADAVAVSRAIVATLGEERDVVVTSAKELRDAADSLLTAFFSLSYAQIAASLAVAFLGVVNALWIAVVLRRRELSLLRAVGATRAQVTRSLVLEAAGLGVVGAACGLAGGALVEWLAVRRVLPADTGWLFPMRFPWTVAAVTAALGVATSALAGFVPARAASSLDIRSVIADE